MSGVTTTWTKSSSNDTLGEDTNSTTTWTEPALNVVSISWAEVLEQFEFWADGNSFWEDVNSNYEDL
tara:strand:- start:1769 stop:1969 length:201 start_codon:yes stop_codon:yes gene_type:complete